MRPSQAQKWVDIGIASRAKVALYHGRPGTPERRTSNISAMALLGVLVTYRRPSELASSLSRLAEQSRRLDRLVVVDNDAGPATRSIVEGSGGTAEYVAAPENLGFAGGVELGMRTVLSEAADGDWIVVFDDDDPAPSRDSLAGLESFAREVTAHDATTAAVGIHGARFDWRRGRIRRVPDEELTGAVAVDYVGGNALPFYRVAAVRDVGPFLADLFFGLSEVEYGLRLRRAGYALYADGAAWQRARERAGRMGRSGDPSVLLSEPGWRRYYTLRNGIYVLRRFGRRGTALRLTVVVGIGKPLANLPFTPRRAVEHLRLNARAIRDGWRGAMGRRLAPDPWGRRPTKPPPVSATMPGDPDG